VEPYDLRNPFVDHILRLIQHNWIVLAYNFNVVILVLIIGELSISAFLLTILLQFYPCYLLPYIIILFLHLLSTNYKCTQPCYFLLLLKPTTQKEKMDWNSSMRSSRLRVAPVAVPVELLNLPLFRFVESRYSL
jgi:hypothetical protein